MDGMKLFAIYLVVMNVLGVAVMWSDKRRARLHRWRIPEKVLFGVSLLGGSAGTWAGMYLFRHKTKHSSFVIGMPLLLLLNIVCIAGVICLAMCG